MENVRSSVKGTPRILWQDKEKGQKERLVTGRGKLRRPLY
jgi:hypothetical protein